MKIKLGFLVAISLLLAASVWAGKWAVDSFDDSSDPGEPDNFIAEEFAGGLKPVKPEQVTQQGGRLYVRQKFEDPFGDEEATYQIFQGRPKEAAKDLGKISLDGIPYTTLLKMKLFYSRTASGNDDLETVYFDGKDIFVEGEDPVYINLNGKMEELKPMVLRDYKISITSEPSGATVTVGGNSKGETPATFTASSNKTIAVVVTKEGYYTVIKPITPSDKGVTQEGVLLTARLPLENPAEVFRTKLRAAKDGNAIKTIKNEIQQALKDYNTSSKKSIDAVMSKFPQNPPKATNESATDYSNRQNLWTNTQARERDALNKDAANYFNELKELAAEADGAAGEMDFALKYEYIPSSAISFTNMGVRDFTIDAELKNSRVNFKYSKAKLGYGSIPRNEVAQNEDRVHGVLKIWDAPENGKYASIYDAAFFYDETPLQVLSKGTFTSSDATTGSRNTEKDLNARIAKFPGKAAWDKKDQAATLEALRAGEIPDPALAAKPPPAEAYYDEEEDEEEFEKGAEEQEKYDYSRHGAAGSATDIFGNTDEYLFWAGVVFAAAAVGSGVVGFLEHKEWQKADDALTSVSDAIGRVEEGIRIVCDYDEQCFQKNRNHFSQPGGYEQITDPDLNKAAKLLYDLDSRKKTNEAARDKRNTNRIIWFSAAGVSAALSITLFVW